MSRLRDSRLGTVLVLAVTTVAILVGVWLVQGGWKDADGATSAVDLTGDVAAAAPAVGAVAPDFAATATDGAAIRLSALQGKPVWLVFGATWCSNCRAEAADIEAVHQAFGDQVTVVTVYVGEAAATVTDYAARLGLTSAQIADESTALGSLYRVLGIPTHYFIAADGTVAAIRVGGLSQQAATDELNDLVAG